MALAEEQVSPEDAWAAANVDEDWQIELWGRDEEAEGVREARRLEFDADQLSDVIHFGKRLVSGRNPAPLYGAGSGTVVAAPRGMNDANPSRSVWATELLGDAARVLHTDVPTAFAALRATLHLVRDSLPEDERHRAGSALPPFLRAVWSEPTEKHAA